MKKINSSKNIRPLIQDQDGMSGGFSDIMASIQMNFGEASAERDKNDCTTANNCGKGKNCGKCGYANQ